MNEENVWVVTGTSESGDDYGPEIYKFEPTDDVLRALVFEWDGDAESPNGPGDYGSYVYLDTQRLRVICSNSNDK